MQGQFWKLNFVCAYLELDDNHNVFTILRSYQYRGEDSSKIAEY